MSLRDILYLGEYGTSKGQTRTTTTLKGVMEYAQFGESELILTNTPPAVECRQQEATGEGSGQYHSRRKT